MDFIRVGQFIRKVRKERGMTLDDLSDEYIPRATLSSIERGISKNPTKINYLLRKLDVHLADLSKKEQEEVEERNLELMILENKINREPTEVLKELEGLPAEYQGALLGYLKGRCNFKLKQYDRAIDCFKDSLNKLGEELNSGKTNIKSFCLNHLSIIAYHRGNNEQALQYTEEGLNSFDRNGERKYYYTVLLTNKAIYLRGLGKKEEALKILDQDSINLFDMNIDGAIGIYNLRANLKREINLFEEAIDCAKKGLGIARINSNFERMIELYITLGEIYKDIRLLDRAEKSLKAAIELKEHISERQYLVLDAYLSLGILYHEQKQFPLAQKTLQRAVKIAKKENRMIEYCQAMLYISKSLLAHARYKEALTGFKDILNLQTNAKTKQEALYGLTQTYLELGDDENYSKYSKQYFRSIQ